MPALRAGPVFDCTIQLIEPATDVGQDPQPPPWPASIRGAKCLIYHCAWPPAGNIKRLRVTGSGHRPLRRQLHSLELRRRVARRKHPASRLSINAIKTRGPKRWPDRQAPAISRCAPCAPLPHRSPCGQNHGDVFLALTMPPSPLFAMRHSGINGCSCASPRRSKAFQPSIKAARSKLDAAICRWMPHQPSVDSRSLRNHPVRPFHVSTSASSARRYSSDAACALVQRVGERGLLFFRRSPRARHFLCCVLAQSGLPPAFCGS